MKRILPLFIMLLLLTGSVIQTYHHKSDFLGNAVIEEKRDISLFIDLLPDVTVEDIKAVCESYSDLNCRVEGAFLTMEVRLEPRNAYYSLETDYGFPFSTTTMTIERIPNDLFDEQINDILEKTDLKSGEGTTRPIDLRDKQSNKAIAAAYRQAGLEAQYTIEMPNGEIRTYDLVELLEDSKPITIRTTELNLWLIILAVGLVALALVSWSFFGNRSGRKKSTTS